jgi:hypothetical protein
MTKGFEPRGTLSEAPARLETAGHDRLSEDGSDLVPEEDRKKAELVARSVGQKGRDRFDADLTKERG